MIEIEAPSEFVCPLTLDVMDDPIMTKYGHSYERSAMLQWLRSGHGDCPLSRRPLNLQDLVSNHGLRMKIQNWREENGEDNPVFVRPMNNLHIYGFITLPTKDDATDRTLDDEEDPFFMQLAATGLGQPQTQPQTQAAAAEDNTSGGQRRRRQRHRRRASTGSAPSSQQRRSITRPFQSLRNLFVIGGRRHSP